MANSSLISDIKNKIVAEITGDEALFYAIDSPDVRSLEYSDELINTHLFTYNQNPLTLNRAITFITILVHIPRTFYKNQYVKIQIEFFICSHESKMKVDNIPKIAANRNDYISQLLDEKFNGRSSLGIDGDPSRLNLWGNLELTSNIEGSYSDNYLFRRMTFESKDINDSLCGGSYAVAY